MEERKRFSRPRPQEDQFDRVLFSLWKQWIWHPISSISEYIVTLVVLPLVRWYIDYLGVWYRRLWYERLPKGFGPGVCLDGHTPNHDVEMTFGVKYGTRQWETVDIVEKKGTKDSEGPVILYLHGGGFVAANSEVLFHSLCIPLARLGCRPFSVNYPLGPTQKYPSQIISTLRAMAWVKQRTGCDEIILVGDSAGGAIISTAAAFLSSKTLEEISAEMDVDITHFDLPQISKVISIYGVLDREGWNNETNPTTGEQPKLEWNDHIGALVLRFCLRCYGADTTALNGRCLLSDFNDDELANFPSTLILCGTQDPLIHGNRKEAKRMQDLGRKVILREYDAHHAFLGFPIAWNFGWKRTTWPAYLEILKFIQDSSTVDMTAFPPNWPCDVHFDFVLPIAVVLCMLLLPLVMVMMVLRFAVGYLTFGGNIKSTSEEVLKYKKGKLNRTNSEIFRAASVQKLSAPIH